jgi:hypothetical protein
VDVNDNDDLIQNRLSTSRNPWAQHIGHPKLLHGGCHLYNAHSWYHSGRYTTVFVDACQNRLLIDLCGTCESNHAQRDLAQTSFGLLLGESRNFVWHSSQFGLSIVRPANIPASTTAALMKEIEFPSTPENFIEKPQLCFTANQETNKRTKLFYIIART